MIQLVDKVNMRFISQLIRDISRVFQKLLKYFNDTAISTSMVLPMRRFLPVIFAFNLNQSGSVMLLFWSSFGTAIKVQIYLHNCHCILLDYTSTSQHIDLLHDLLANYIYRLRIQWMMHNFGCYFFRLLVVQVHLLQHQ